MHCPGLQAWCVAPQATELCLQIPAASDFVWPVSPQSVDGYDYCIPRPIFFTPCAARSASIYQFFINTDNELCLQTSSALGNDPLKVYFIVDTNPCDNHQCFITSIVSSHWINKKCKI